MGFKTGAQPPVVRSVQPVQVVSDATGIVSPELGALASAGARRGPVGAEFATFEFHSLAPGGAQVRLAAGYNGTTFTQYYTFGAVAAALNNVITPIVYQQNPEVPAVSTVRLGTTVATINGGAALNPSLTTTNGATWEFDIYVPPGTFLFASVTTGGQAGQWAAQWAEFPGRDSN